MAVDFRIEGEARLDTSRAEKDLANFARKAERTQIKLQGIDSKKFTQPLGKITGSIAEFQKSLDASNARVIAFTASAGILYGVTSAFKEMAKATIEVEKTLAGINVILNASSSNLKKFSNNLFDVAKNTGQSFQQVGEAAQEFARQGLGMEKTITRTRDALILMRLSGMDATAAVNSLTAAINSFNRTAITSTEIINKMANVDAAFAVSTNDLAEAIKRVASTAEGANVSFDELIAVVTSAQQTTARGGNIIGNSLKTIFTRVQRTGVQQQLEALGVQVKKMNGDLRPAMAIMKDFAKAYDGLGSAAKAQTAELVGGVYQMNILKAILGDLKKGTSIYEQALKTSLNTTDEAIRRNQELNKTLAALTNESVQNLTKMGAEIGALSFEPAFRALLDGFNKLTEKTSFFGDIAGFFGFNDKEANDFGGRMAKGVMQSIGNFLSGPGLIALTAIAGKLFYNFVTFLAKSTKDMMGLNKAAQQQAAVQQQIHGILSSNPALIKKIETGEMSVLKAENLILEALKSEIIAREKLLSLSRQMTPAVGSQVGARIDKSTGTTTLIRKSSGHVPSFNAGMSEYIGALQAGYKPGRIKTMSIPGEGRVTYNGAEKVKRFPGIKQPAIIPPGKAGKSYGKAFESQWGFSPDSSGPSAFGFVPNLLQFLTSLRLGVDKQGRQGSSGRLKIRGDVLAKEVGPELGKVIKYVIPGSEYVTINTLGQQKPITEKERAGFTKGTGRRAAKKGGQQEAALAARYGGFGMGRFRGKSQAAKDMDPQKLKLPYDSGERVGGRNFAVESKPSFRARYVAQIFKKTLYETNSSSLRHLKRRLQSKIKGGDQMAAAHLRTLENRIGIETKNRGNELSTWTMSPSGTPAIGSLGEMNRIMGFDTKNALAARKEKLFSGGFIPNFAVAEPRRVGGVWDATRSAAMLVPEMGLGAGRGTSAIASVPGTGRGKKSTRIKFNIYDPDIPKNRRDSLHKKVEKSLTKTATAYAREFSPDPIKPALTPEPGKYFNTGALKSAVGNVFEAGLDAAFARAKDVETARFDVRSGTKGSGKVRNLFGVPFVGHADYKAQNSPTLRKSMAEKIANEFRRIRSEVSSKKGTKGKGKSGGFIPNFGVMEAIETEQALGGKPTLDYNPRVGVYVRDAKTQSSFADVVRDHPEGIGRAVQNSKAAQKVLSSSGFVPNFAEDEGGGMTGVDTGINTMALAFMAMGAKDLADKFKETGSAAIELRTRFEAMQAEGEDLKERQRELGDGAEQAEQALEEFAKNLKNTKKDDKDLAKADKLDKERGRDDLTGKEKSEAREKAGLKGRKTSSMTDEEKEKLEKEENKILTQSNKDRKKEADEIRASVQQRKKNKVSRTKEGAALDKEVATRKQLEIDLQEERAAHDKNSAALTREAAAHNRNAMSSGQMVGGAAAGAAGGGMMGSLKRGGGMVGQWGQQGAMMGMMAMPMVGGAMAGLGMDEQKSKVVQDSMSIGLMGAMSGNPWVMAGAATFAVLDGIEKWGEASRDQTKKWKEALEGANEKLQEFQNLSQEYLKNQAEYQQALTDPDISPEQLKKRTDAMFESVRNVPREFAADVRAAAHSGDELKKTFERIEKSLKDVAKDIEAAGTIEKGRKERDEIGWWFWGHQGGDKTGVEGGFGGGAAAAGGAEQARKQRFNAAAARDAVVDSVMRRLEKEDVQGFAGKELRRKLMAGTRPGIKHNERVKNNMQWFAEVGLNPELMEAIEQVLVKGIHDMTALNGAILHRLKAESEAADELDKLAEVIRKNKEISGVFNVAMKRAGEQLDHFNFNLKSITDIARKRVEGHNERRRMRESYSRKAVLTNARGHSKLIDPFEGKWDQMQRKQQIAEMATMEKYLASGQLLVAKTQRSIIGVLDKKLDENAKTVQRLQLKQYKEGQPLSITEKTELKKRERAQQAFSEILGKALHQSAAAPEQMMPNIVKNLRRELNTVGLSSTEIDSVVNEIGSLKESAEQSLMKLLQQQQEEIMIQKIQTKNQERLIELQQQLKFGGGIASFAGGERWKKTRSLREERAEAEFSPTIPQRLMNRGRADFKSLQDLTKNFSMDAGQLSDPTYDKMIASAVLGLTLDVQKQLKIKDKNLRSWGGAKPDDELWRQGVFKSMSEGAIDDAMQQVSAALKLKALPEDVIKIRNDMELLREMFGDQWRFLEEANQSAFTRAIKETGIDNIGTVITATNEAGFQSIDDSLSRLITAFNVGFGIQTYMKNLQEINKNEKRAMQLMNSTSDAEQERLSQQGKMDVQFKDLRSKYLAMQMGWMKWDQGNLLADGSGGTAEKAQREARTAQAKAFMSVGQALFDDPNLSHAGRVEALKQIARGQIPSDVRFDSGVLANMGPDFQANLAVAKAGNWQPWEKDAAGNTVWSQDGMYRKRGTYTQKELDAGRIVPLGGGALPAIGDDFFENGVSDEGDFFVKYKKGEEATLYGALSQIIDRNVGTGTQWVKMFTSLLGGTTGGDRVINQQGAWFMAKKLGYTGVEPNDRTGDRGDEDWLASYKHAYQKYMKYGEDLPNISRRAQIAEKERLAEAHRQRGDIWTLKGDNITEFSRRDNIDKHEKRELEIQRKKAYSEAERHKKLSIKLSKEALGMSEEWDLAPNDKQEQYFKDALEWERRRIRLLDERIDRQEAVLNLKAKERAIDQGGQVFEVSGAGPLNPPPPADLARDFRERAVRNQALKVRDARIELAVDKETARKEVPKAGSYGESGMKKNRFWQGALAIDAYFRLQASENLKDQEDAERYKASLVGGWTKGGKGGKKSIDMTDAELRDLATGLKRLAALRDQEYYNEERERLNEGRDPNLRPMTAGPSLFTDWGKEFWWNQQQERMSQMDAILPDFKRIQKEAEWLFRGGTAKEWAGFGTGTRLGLTAVAESSPQSVLNEVQMALETGIKESKIEGSIRSRLEQLQDKFDNDIDNFDRQDALEQAQLMGVLEAIKKIGEEHGDVVKLQEYRLRIEKAIANVQAGSLQDQIKALQILRDIDIQKFMEKGYAADTAFKRAKFTGLESRTELGQLKDTSLGYKFKEVFADWGRDQDFDKILGGDFALTDFQKTLVDRLEVLFDEDHENFFRKLQGTLDDNVQKLMKLERLPATRDNRAAFSAARATRHSASMERLQFGGYTPNVSLQAARYGITAEEVKGYDAPAPRRGAMPADTQTVPPAHYVKKYGDNAKAKWAGLTPAEKHVEWKKQMATEHASAVGDWRRGRKATEEKFTAAGIPIGDRGSMLRTSVHQPGIGRLFGQPELGSNWDQAGRLSGVGGQMFGVGGWRHLAKAQQGPLGEEMKTYIKDQMIDLNDALENAMLDNLDTQLSPMKTVQEKITSLANLNELRVRKYESQFAKIYDNEIKDEAAKTERRRILFEMQLKNADQANEDLSQLNRRIFEASLTPTANRAGQREMRSGRIGLSMDAWRKNYASMAYQGGQSTGFDFWGAATRDPSAASAAQATRPTATAWRNARLKESDQTKVMAEEMRLELEIMEAQEEDPKKIAQLRAKYEHYKTQANALRQAAMQSDSVIRERYLDIQIAQKEVDKILKQYVEDQVDNLDDLIGGLTDQIRLEGLDPTLYAIQRMPAKKKKLDEQIRKILAPNEQLGTQLVMEDIRSVMEDATDAQRDTLKELQKLLKEGFNLQLQQLDAEIKELDRSILQLRSGPATSDNLQQLASGLEKRIEKSLEQFMFGTGGGGKDQNLIDTIKKRLGLDTSSGGKRPGYAPLGLFPSQSRLIQAGQAPANSWRSLNIGWNQTPEAARRAGIDARPLGGEAPGVPYWSDSKSPLKKKLGGLLASLGIQGKGERPKWITDLEKKFGLNKQGGRVLHGYLQGSLGTSEDVFGPGQSPEVQKRLFDELTQLDLGGQKLTPKQIREFYLAMTKAQKNFHENSLKMSKEAHDNRFQLERRTLYLMKASGAMPSAISAQEEKTWQAGRAAWQVGTASLLKDHPDLMPGKIQPGITTPIAPVIENMKVAAKRAWAKHDTLMLGEDVEGALAASEEAKKYEHQAKLLEQMAKDGKSLEEAWKNIKIKKLKNDLTDLREQINLDMLDPGTLSRETIEARREETRKSIKDGSYQMKQTFKDLFAAWHYGTKEMMIDADEALFTFGMEFRSGIASAFGEAIKGTKTLEEAFSDMFLKLADYALDQVLQMTVNRVIGSFAQAAPAATGGLITNNGVQKFARGGPVVGGSGTKDDVPAFLQQGEYVLRKAAVKKYGVSLIDLINNEGFGAVNKYATGGRVGAGVRAGRGPGKIVGDPKLGQPAYILYPDGSKTLVSEMTALRRQRGLPQYEHTDPDPSFFGKKNYKVDYWTHLSEPTTHGGLGMSTKDIAKLKAQWEANAFADPQEGLVSNIKHGREGRWVDYNLRNAFVYDSDKFPSLDHSYFSIDPRLTRQALADSDNPRNKIRQDKVSKLYSYYEDRASDLIAHAEAVAKWKAAKKKRMKYSMIAAAASLGISALTGGAGLGMPGAQGTVGGNFFSWLGGASGGAVTSRGIGKATGGLIGDAIPAMLMGGEYVVNRSAVQKYGSDFFTQLNKGNVPAFASGGYVGGNGLRSSKGSEKNAKGIMSEPSVADGDTTNNITINVNLNENGGITTDVNTGGEGISLEKARSLGTLIKQTVVETIVQQKRQGGILHQSTQNRG
jgi:TP901 family phage tail tape measure protein